MARISEVWSYHDVVTGEVLNNINHYHDVVRFLIILIIIMMW